MIPQETMEEQYLEVLEAIERPVLEFYRTHAELLDFQVEEALGAVISRVRTLARSETALPFRLKGLTLGLAEALLAWTEQQRAQADPVDAEVLLLCLARVRKSVRFWSKRDGSRGYLEYVSSMM